MGCKLCTFALVLFLFISAKSWSQNSSSIKFDAFEQLYLQNKYDSIIQYAFNDIKLEKDFQSPKVYEMFAKSYAALNRSDRALYFYKNALKQYEQQKNFDSVAYINLEIYNLLDSQSDLDVNKTPYLEKVRTYAISSKAQKWLIPYHSFKGINCLKQEKPDSAKYYFLKAYKIAEDLDTINYLTKLNLNLGALYSGNYNDQDAALKYYKNALNASLNDTIYQKNKNLKFAIYNNIGNCYRRKLDFQNALEYYNLAEDIQLDKYDKESKRILFDNMNVTYYYMNDWKNAYDYLYKYDSINQLLEIKEQNTNITDIEEKYQNEKLRADNLEIESKSLQNRNIAYGLGGSLVLGSIIVFLIYKNNLRNQEIEKQEQLIRNEKLTNQLKEQELISINAMIAGQEKERLRIANDLHDDLGSLMASIKMHFGSLKGKSSTDLYKRTNTLIEEAYQKIRNIAHAKNSGVLAKQGFLKAVKQLAKSVSNSEKIQIKVSENGLNQRLENSLEITLFRIVQELITNVIKHAEASEVDIHLNQHDNTLNIMVEDNGKGFDPSQITKNKTGIGLTSIERRIENLDGKMVIESQPKSGTSIIIDIPL